MASKIEEILVPVVDVVMGTLVSQVPEERMQDVADNLLDRIEDLVDGTGTKIDDAIIKPVINRIRETFNIPDGDD